MKLRTLQRDGSVELKVLIEHPMESGRRLDETTGLAIPAHYIRELTVAVNDRIVIRAELGTAIARNPYFAFYLAEGKTGDRIRVTWVDNRGASETGETRLEESLTQALPRFNR